MFDFIVFNFHCNTLMEFYLLKCSPDFRSTKNDSGSRGFILSEFHKHSVLFQLQYFNFKKIDNHRLLVSEEIQAQCIQL